jgi:hypothetical protein
MGLYVPTLEAEGRQRVGGALRGIGISVVHKLLIVT